LAIALANLPLVWGGLNTNWILRGAPGNGVTSVLLHPLVHVSWYHLALDAGAFLALYAVLSDLRLRDRLFCLAACAAGSALGALLDPAFQSNGLCGVSGIAHGLLAAVTWREAFRGATPALRRAAVCVLVGVAGKALLEAIAGQGLFTAWHLGQVGVPNRTCHLGGIIAGSLAAWAILGFTPKRHSSDNDAMAVA
jgi:hypothetical protein